MGYQGMLIEMAKEYVVLATSQSQSLMCGGQMSCNKHLMNGWEPVEPQIIWNRSAVLGQASSAKPPNRQQQHYIPVSQFAEKSPEPMTFQPPLPPRNPSMQQQHELPGLSCDEENIGQAGPAVADNANAKEAAAKSKKRFRLFRTMRSVIKSRFRK